VWGLKRQRTAPLGNIAPHGSSVEVVLVLVGVVWLLETESVALLGHYDDCLGITDRWFACFAFAPERQVRYGLEFKFSVFCGASCLLERRVKRDNITSTLRIAHPMYRRPSHMDSNVLDV